jgi:hypothetical protein
MITPAALAVAAALVAGPPWISIEYPVNPHDRSMNGAILLVHVFHHSTPIAYPIEGTAEGIVNGERRSIKLTFTETSRPAVYGLSRQWGTEGVWTLVIKMSRGDHGQTGRRQWWSSVLTERSRRSAYRRDNRMGGPFPPTSR